MSDLWPQDRCLLIGMVHLGPILQRHQESLVEVEARAVDDALVLAETGFDVVMIENFGDTPFYPKRVPAHTIAGMTRVAYAVQQAISKTHASPLLGINVLRNDAQAALAVAAAVDAALIRVNVHTGAMLTDQGWIEGEAHETCRYRDQIAPNTAIFTDIRVKHAASLVQRPLVDEAEELWERGKADALILTGSGTGIESNPQDLHSLREAIPDCKLVVGSGVSPAQLPLLLPWADALIVGSWLKRDGRVHNPIDPLRARELVEAVR